jgi:hypothetical protein
MPDSTLADLPEAVTLGDDDNVYLVQGGADKRIKGSTLKGAVGDTGAALVELTSPAEISGGRVVKTDGNYYNPSAATPGAALGLSTGAASAGATLTVRTSGAMTDPAWAWTAGPVFVTGNGVLTQTAPTTGIVLQVATALSATKIVVDIKVPVKKAS